MINHMETENDLNVTVSDASAVTAETAAGDETTSAVADVDREHTISADSVEYRMRADVIRQTIDSGVNGSEAVRQLKNGGKLLSPPPCGMKSYSKLSILKRRTMSHLS